MKKVRLSAVDENNWEAVCDLKLTAEQKSFVSSNLYSIAESRFNRYAQPMAIYAGKKLVGFLMYESMHQDDAPDDYSIYRFMVDKKRQGKGYGREALKLAIKEIQNNSRWRNVFICYEPENTVAANLYKSIGFVETGLDDDGEMVAVIRNTGIRK